jgi:hypothetical protein
MYKLTAAANHALNPTFRGSASFAIPAYTALICAGAGTVPGRACGELMRALRAGDSFGIVYLFLFIPINGLNWIYTIWYMIMIRREGLFYMFILGLGRRCGR